MAVTIMVGFAFVTVLTLVVLPVLYVTFFRVHTPKLDELSAKFQGRPEELSQG